MVSFVEQLIQKREFRGNADVFFSLIESCVITRPVSGVISRPVSGVISRPVSGVISRPVSGVISRPVSYDSVKTGHCCCMRRHRLFVFYARVFARLQEPSVLLLVEHKAKQINMQEDSWLPQLLQIMDRFYK